MATKTDTPELLTLAAVARILGLSRSTVYRLRERGEIPAVKIGGSIRVRAEDLARLTQPKA